MKVSVEVGHKQLNLPSVSRGDCGVVCPDIHDAKRMFTLVVPPNQLDAFKKEIKDGVEIQALSVIHEDGDRGELWFRQSPKQPRERVHGSVGYTFDQKVGRLRVVSQWPMV
jgi:hypothetical protein